ncbi:hypothetical protein [Rhizobium oryzicola]|uniref:Exopeptide n=1 Tax=Rhizobium oryzicola TaxID=1232668 RepID=A0ABT8SUP0_9HYPH|nr:hypothetical protein [Rhizobium oryzicola]MDO1581452.1 hypothetical protein [Rhizobium oryzicola]
MRITWFLLILALIAIVLSIPLIDRNHPMDSRSPQSLKSDNAPLLPPPPAQRQP